MAQHSVNQSVCPEEHFHLKCVLSAPALKCITTKKESQAREGGGGGIKLQLAPPQLSFSSSNERWRRNVFSLRPGLGWEGKGCFGSFSTTSHQSPVSTVSAVQCSFFLPTNCQFYDIKRTFSPLSPLISFTPLSKFSQTICKENHGLKFGQNPV